MNCDFSPIGFLLLLLVIQSRLLSTLVVAVFFLRLSSVVVVVISLIINRIRKYQTNDDNVKKLRSGTGRGVLDRILLLLSRIDRLHAGTVRAGRSLKCARGPA